MLAIERHGIILEKTKNDFEKLGVLKIWLKQPLFSPTEIWEKDGYVNNVVFPTGTTILVKTFIYTMVQQIAQV
ncbi:MAG: hypothetical protein WC389_05695 [Lutibacter sp.]|jgi:predicted GH43/DUF377 family glycosyl hydrolase